ncbi:MAG: phosphoribosylglycinamide formyltransferase [Acidobacteria bacterium]|nr:phosphoribosylglycinamide formyltransferase [Acidobacteriota bacterium]
MSGDPVTDAGRFAVLISGRGSNMLSLVNAAQAGRIPALPAVVISNVAAAPGLAAASDLGVPTAVVDHRASANREEHDGKVLQVLAEHGADLVCLAGYTRLLSPDFIGAYPGRILNIHPSLLPAFPGLHAQRQAMEQGVKISGCTVHFVDEQLDHGPIVAQAAVPVQDDDDEDLLAARILEAEHRLYPEALRRYYLGHLVVSGRRVRIQEPDDE